MFPESLVVTFPEPWLLIEAPTSEIDACGWGGRVCCLAFCPGLGVVVALVGFLSLRVVGPIVVMLAGTSSLPLLNSPSDIWLRLSFTQPALLVVKPCPKVGDIVGLILSFTQPALLVVKPCPEVGDIVGLRLSFIQPALLVVKPCPLESSSLVVSFFCFHPSASSWKGSKRWSHLSFVLDIFQILNIGIVIINNAVLLHIFNLWKTYLIEGCTFIFSESLNLVWLATFCSSDFIVRLLLVPVEGLAAAAFALRQLIEPSVKISGISSLVCVLSSSSESPLTEFSEGSTSSWLPRTSCMTSLSLILVPSILLTVVSGTWQPDYIVEPLPLNLNSLLQNPTSPRTSWTSLYRPQGFFCKRAWIYFSKVFGYGGRY